MLSHTTQSLDDINKHHQTKPKNSKVKKRFLTLDLSYAIGDGNIIGCPDACYMLKCEAISEWLIASFCIIKCTIQI